MRLSVHGMDNEKKAQGSLQTKEGEVPIVGDWEQDCGADHDPTRNDFCGSN